MLTKCDAARLVICIEKDLVSTCRCLEYSPTRSNGGMCFLSDPSQAFDFRPQGSPIPVASTLNSVSNGPCCTTDLAAVHRWSHSTRV